MACFLLSKNWLLFCSQLGHHLKLEIMTKINFTETEFDKLFLIETPSFNDTCGYFSEVYNYQALRAMGIEMTFVQDNHLRSLKGAIRGLHYQNAPHAQARLVHCLSGRILYVALDLRKEKKTFGKSFQVELNQDNHRQILIPKGFAHGIIALSDYAEIFYKVDELYYPRLRGGISFNDPDLHIDWKTPESDMIISVQDKMLPRLSKAKFTFN